MSETNGAGAGMPEAAGRSVVCRSPLDGSEMHHYERHDAAEVERIVAAAESAYREWTLVPLSRRGELMAGLADRLEAEADSLARLMAVEMGKPVAAGRAEARKCALACRYYAENAGRHLADRPVEVQDGAGAATVVFRPLGVVLAVMPWNFPFWQVFRCAVPAIMAGNAVVLKHASNVPRCADRIESLFLESGFPSGLLGRVHLAGEDAASLVGDRRVSAVSLTGSTPAGRAIAAEAGRHLKKCVLELGGSDPYIVLADADVGAAARICAKARLVNAGQSCIAAKRFIVIESVRPAFEAALVEAMRGLPMGDPLAEGIEIGPLARHDLRDELHRQVTASLAAGARLLLGGAPPTDPELAAGAFYPPTVLADVVPGMPVFDEETFGPVASVTAAADVDDALELANRTPFGLGAAVFTASPEVGRRIAREDLEAGTCVVNTFVQSDPRLPFGGIRDSGYGRELSAFGIREFVNIKTLVVHDRPAS